MASLSKIGAQIGVEGYDQFHKQILNIKNDLKGLQSEMKAISTSFTAESKTIQDVNKQREQYSKLIADTERKLQTEREVIEKIRQARATEIPANYQKAREEIINSLGTEAEIKDKLQKAEDDYNAAMNRSVAEQQKYEIQANNTQAALNKLNNEMNELPADNFVGRLAVVKNALANNNSELMQMGQFLSSIGSFMTKAFTLPIVAGATASVKSFSDVESAFTGVMKTVEEETKTYAEIQKDLWDIALNTSSSFEQVAAAAEIAGQLGIHDYDLKNFTETMIRFGDSTNLAADEAATAFARILNITGESTDNIEKLGNVVVYLGNNYATTEAEITHMSNRLAAGATLAGLSTTELFALATAMSSVGITAEAGGTAMTQTLTKIEKEVTAFRQGAENDVATIAEISGMSAEAFADAWENEPITAISSFISGLGALDEKGESATLVLDELGMAGIRQSNMLKSLALASDVLTGAVEDANYAYDQSNALMDESDKRYATFDAQVNQLKESFKLFGSTVGESIGKTLLPLVEGLTKALTAMAEWWQGLSEPMQKFILAIAGIVAVIGPLLAIAGGILIFIAQVSAAAEALGITLAGVGAVLSGTVLPIVAVIAGIVALYEAIKHGAEIREFFDKLWASIGQALSDGLEQIKGWLKDFTDYALSGILSLFERVLTRILTFALVDIPNFISRVQNAWETFKTNTANTFKNIASNIGDTFRNLISSAWNWGADFIRGFKDGITNKLSELWSSVKSIASGIASYLHFSEPDKGALSDFHTWMPDMMRGLAQGIDDYSYLVENAISRVAGMMDMGTAVNYGGVVINLNVPAGTNGRQLVDEIETELANRTMRRRAVFG